MLETQNTERFEMLNIFKVLVIIFSLLIVYNYHHKTTPIIVRIEHPTFSLLGPYNTTKHNIKDEYAKLINLTNFTFLNNPQCCKGYENGLLLLAMISTKIDHFERRAVIRNTWGRSIDSIKVVFLVGMSENDTLSKKISDESDTYKDMVQGNFIDSYRNLTYKHVMGLKWVTHHCSTARYILKTDDDVAVNSHTLRQFLTRQLSPWGATGLIACPVLKHAKVYRTTDSKWMVSEQEYPGSYYPDYCAGWTVIYSQDVIPILLTTIQKLPYFWIDDVHITGIAAEMNHIARTPLTSLILSHRRMNMLTSWGARFAGQFLFAPPELSTDKITEIWKAIPE